MRRAAAGVWVGRALALLGLAAVAAAVRAAHLWALVAALGGCLVAAGLALVPLMRAWLAEAPRDQPSDFAHTLDLLRRAHGARAAWLVGLSQGDLEAVGAGAGAPAGRHRCAQLAQGGAAVVLQGMGPRLGGARLVAVSTAADSRLAGLALPLDAPARRAVASGVPVVTHGGEDIFGSALPDRRRQDRAGTAYPLFDGHFAIGALVVMGPPLAAGSPVADPLQRLVTELGARLAAARALHDAEH